MLRHVSCYSPDSLERADGLVILTLQLFHQPEPSGGISADKTDSAFIDKSASMFDQAAQVTHPAAGSFQRQQLPTIVAPRQGCE